MSFDIAYARSMGNEGSYKRDPQDRGDWTSGVIGKGELKGTKCGISAMSYPDLDIKNLTSEDIKAIYKRDWWDKLGLDKYPQALPYQLFDMAINSGWHNAAETLQRAIGVKADGVIGKVTMAKLASLDKNDILMLFLAERLEFMTNLSTWGTYGRGWARRIAQNLRYASQDN